ncbi:hypothetical protein Q4S25_18730, partial [Morganella morganii]
TTVTCRMEGAQLPSPENECYLKAKAVFASYFPRVSYRKDGAKRSLKQLVMSGLIRAEESLAKFKWPYKAEVVFAMRGEVNTPLPIMATSQAKLNDEEYKGNLPHSENPFAMPTAGQWATKGVSGRRRTGTSSFFDSQAAHVASDFSVCRSSPLSTGTGQLRV